MAEWIVLCETQNERNTEARSDAEQKIVALDLHRQLCGDRFGRISGIDRPLHQTIDGPAQSASREHDGSRAGYHANLRHDAPHGPSTYGGTLSWGAVAVNTLPGWAGSTGAAIVSFRHRDCLKQAVDDAVKL